MQQIVDLQNDPEFQALDVALVSIASDTLEELRQEGAQWGISTVPLLSDRERQVSAAYAVLQLAVPSGEPGHTFVLLDRDGRVAWIRDYGAPENGGLMYVPAAELTQAIRTHLAGRQAR